MKELGVGDKAPLFTLTSQHGNTVKLEDLLKKGPVVLYFYPKDETSVCTSQACAFRDQYSDFTAAHAQVVGISSDSVASHEQFAAKHNLPFLLLSDIDGEVRQAFGVPKTLGLMPGRVTYVLDREGVIRYTFNSAFRAQAHVSHALEIVKQITAP